MYSLRLLLVIIVFISGIVDSGHAAFVPNQYSYTLRSAEIKTIVPTSPQMRLKAPTARSNMVGDGSETPNTKRTLFCAFGKDEDSAKKRGTAAENADFRRSSRQNSKSVSKIGNTFAYTATKFEKTAVKVSKAVTKIGDAAFETSESAKKVGDAATAIGGASIEASKAATRIADAAAKIGDATVEASTAVTKIGDAAAKASKAATKIGDSAVEISKAVTESSEKIGDAAVKIENAAVEASNSASKFVVTLQSAFYSAAAFFLLSALQSVSKHVVIISTIVSAIAPYIFQVSNFML